MGAKLSKRRHHRSGEVVLATSATSLDEDAAIGGTGGAVTGFVSGVAFVFINAIGLRTSMSIVGLCVVGGTVVGALVCIAGAVVVKSLAWLYRQLRKRTRRGMEVQLQVLHSAMAVAPRPAVGTAAAAAAGGATTTATTTAAAQQAALAQAREERARAVRDLEEYDRLLAEAEAQLRGALAATAGGSNEGEAAAGTDDSVEEEEEKTNATDTAVAGEVVAVPVAAAPMTTTAAVQPPAEFFRPTPVHITLRLRDVYSDDSDGTTDDEQAYYLIDRLEEGQGSRQQQQQQQGAGVATPPIY